MDLTLSVGEVLPPAGHNGDTVLPVKAASHSGPQLKDGGWNVLVVDAGSLRYRVEEVDERLVAHLPTVKAKTDQRMKREGAEKENSYSRIGVGDSLDPRSGWKVQLEVDRTDDCDGTSQGVAGESDGRGIVSGHGSFDGSQDLFRGSIDCEDLSEGLRDTKPRTHAAWASPQPSCVFTVDGTPGNRAGLKDLKLKLRVVIIGTLDFFGQ